MRAGRTNLATLVDDFACHGTDLAAVASSGLRERRITYAELTALSRRFAAELTRRGITKGDRVLLCGANSPEWLAAFYGCVLRGVLAVPLDVQSTPDFFQRVAGDISPKLVLIDVGDDRARTLAVPSLAFSELPQSLSNEWAGADPTLMPDDPFQIIFTSGTTSIAKGVVHSHRNVLASLEPIEQEIARYRKYERPFHPIRFLHTLPLSHVFGQFMGLWIPPLLGSPVRYESRLVSSELIGRIRGERISVLACVPRVLDLLRAYLVSEIPDLEARIASSGGWKAWKRWWHFRDVHRMLGFKFWAIICGGASLPSKLEQFWGRLGFVVVQGYGMTETTALVSLNHPFRAAEGTVGKVLPGREVRLSAEGEVLVRGETISTLAWEHGMITASGSPWLATGDLAEFDAEGNLRFRGRKKELIVTAAGLNIYPEDLEAALLAQPGTRGAAVIETTVGPGPEPEAVLLLAPGADGAQIVSAANAQLAPYQQVHRWRVWPDADFPRTSTGKVLKRELLQRSVEGGAGQTQQSSEPLDSLGRVELQAKLEARYGIALDDSAMQSVQSEAEAHVLAAAGALKERALGRASDGAVDFSHAYPRWPWNQTVVAVRSLFLECVALPLVRLLARPAFVSRITAWPDTPVLLVANHVTTYDVPLILSALPGAVRRKVAVAMSGEMLLDLRRGRNQGHWLLNLLAPAGYFLITALFNVFPLPQRSGFQRSFRHAGEAMNRGYHILVFPEGRRSDDGSPQPFQSGAGLLWKELQSPAVAVRLNGIGELKRLGGRWFRTGKITVQVPSVLVSVFEEPIPVLAKRLQNAVFPVDTD